ncbi:electron transport complex subunit RsxB [Acidovorax sp. NCPPB 2350]|nr:electron transport complex subunit RsxB [Acidovorax sp. NCPPB 2350]
MNPVRPALEGLVARIDAVLPQTQCTRCGYPDCAAYARAVACGDAEINRCPPGGAQGVARLAALTGRPVVPLDPDCGSEAPRSLAVIDEHWCIGCTLCIKACPTDAILGTNKYMHTVIPEHCTGCELCIPVCPVDCISLENASGSDTGWSAWSAGHAQHARQRYEARQIRQDAENDAAHATVASESSSSTPAPEHTKEPSPPADDPAAARRAAIAAAMARARGQRMPGN